MITQLKHQAIATEIRRAHARYLNPHSGFLPSRTPLKTVTAAFQPYADACERLPGYLADSSRGCRAWLDTAFSTYDPVLLEQIDEMSFAEQSKCAVLFSVLGHGYRWDTLPSPSRDFCLDALDLPKGLAAPWAHVSTALGQPMVGTLWSLLLYNWEIVGKAGGEHYTNEALVYDKMQVLHSFHGPPQDEQLRAFVLVLVLTEARGARVINSLMDLIECVAQEDEEACIGHFDVLISALKEMNHVFMTLIRNRVLDPVSWLDNIQRPYVWGVKDQHGHSLEGPSGMQLGVMTCINTALDIRSTSSLAQSVHKSRMYLPTGHRAFHEVFDNSRPMIREFVARSQNTTLRAGYNEALSVMAVWKQMHHRRGKMYFKGDPNSKGMETSTGLVVTEGESLLTHFEKAMEERIIETEQTKIVRDVSDYSDSELQYLEDLKECLADNNIVSADERRILDRRRDQLGIAEERAHQIEETSKIKSSFGPRELEYLAEFEFHTTRAQGVDSEARSRLQELAAELRLNAERVAVLEAHLLGDSSEQLSTADEAYLDELKFCLDNDGVIKPEERRHLIRVRKRLGLTEERTHELEHYHSTCLRGAS